MVGFSVLHCRRGSSGLWSPVEHPKNKQNFLTEVTELCVVNETVSLLLPSDSLPTRKLKKGVWGAGGGQIHFCLISEVFS